MLDLLAVAAHGAVEEHAEATALGIAPGGYVALAMLVVFGIMLYAKVPALVVQAEAGQHELQQGKRRRKP